MQDTIELSKRIDQTLHTWVFGIDTDRMVAWPYQFRQGGETYGPVYEDIPEFVIGQVEEFGFEVEQR